MLLDGVDAVTEIPVSRWNHAEFYEPDLGAVNKAYVREGAFLENVDQFDPRFFGLTPNEAKLMDPQQRLLLEVVWETLEESGIPPASLVGTETGFFLGLMNDDYRRFVSVKHSDCLSSTSEFGLGEVFGTARPSYLLGLQGPNMLVKTQCSSSLVAVHLACKSLQRRESQLAFAAGSSLMLAPETTVILSNMRALSPDGRCKALDAAANGYGRGEGVGVVLLKRLEDARRDGDRIWAVIRGTAVNHGGRSTNMATPNGLAQRQLIRQALADGGLHENAVDYVELHGTGTSLGDPIELGALGGVFGQRRRSDRPLAIGSLKTNVGHMEATAGVGGLVKAVMALTNEELPRHLHLRRLNPHLGHDSLPFGVVGGRMPWPRRQGHLRVAGISSFGMSGTNAHILLEESPEMVWPRQTRKNSSFSALAYCIYQNANNTSETTPRVCRSS